MTKHGNLVCSVIKGCKSTFVFSDFRKALALNYLKDCILTALSLGSATVATPLGASLVIRIRTPAVEPCNWQQSQPRCPVPFIPFCRWGNHVSEKLNLQWTHTQNRWLKGVKLRISDPCPWTSSRMWFRLGVGSIEMTYPGSCLSSQPSCEQGEEGVS